MITIPYEVAENIADGYDSECDNYKYVDSTDWKVEHKCSIKDFIFSYQNNFYRLRVYTTGDGWCSDRYGTSFFETEEFECEEVFPREIKKIVWE